MKIAIIGAGFAGISSAKVLRQFGHEVTVFEKTPDVGGVWSQTRNYPGLTTQNVRDTYSLSDLDMPKNFPEYPRSQDVQAYLADYVAKMDLESSLRLSTAVSKAELDDASGKWTVTSRAEDGAENSEQFDQLVVANGIFSDPLIPDYSGKEAYKNAGGRLCAVSDVQSLDELRGKHVLVVGYGKSACDMAASASEVATSTSVIARHLIWKLPKKVGKAVHYKNLFLTRMGEGLIRYHTLRGFEAFLHGVGKPMRNSMLKSVQMAVTWQLKLKKHNLVPDGSFEEIARSTVSLVTDGFFEGVDKGTIKVKREATIERLFEADGQLQAQLSTGEVLPADVVICGTGWKQSVPFFSAEMHDRLTNDTGDYELYQYIHPLTVPNLFFVGYNSSFFSPLSAETAALWVAAYLDGMVELPPLEQRRDKVAKRLKWMKERTRGKHAHGTNLIPFSMHNIDETLNELDANVGTMTRFKQWLIPPNPADYQKIAQKLLERRKKSKVAAAEPVGAK